MSRRTRHDGDGNISDNVMQGEVVMVFLNEKDGGIKLDLLVNRLSAIVDLRRKYHLMLATGYFSREAAEQVIDGLQGFNIQRIDLYLPRSIAVQEKDELLGMMEERKNLLWVYPVRGNFFHTKAYCLASYDDWYSDDAQPTGGCLAIGSSNLTGNGMVSNSGNVESLVVSDDLPQIMEFIESLDNINWMEFEDLHEYVRNDEHDFRYDILSQGKFVHKYESRLNNYLAIRYSLSHESKNIQKQDFEELGIPSGFEPDTSTIGKQYFDFDIDPYRPDGYRDLRRNYGIECYFGHWIPKIVVPELMDEQFQKFKKEMFLEIRKRMESITSEIKKDYSTLTGRGIIETDTDKGDPSENFKRKVDELEKDDDRLFRIWSQLAFNDFPYDRNDTQNIDEIYKDIITTIELSRRRNSTKRAIIELLDKFEQKGKFVMPEFFIDENGSVKLRTGRMT